MKQTSFSGWGRGVPYFKPEMIPQTFTPNLLSYALTSDARLMHHYQHKHQHHPLLMVMMKQLRKLMTVHFNNKVVIVLVVAVIWMVKLIYSMVGGDNNSNCCWEWQCYWLSRSNFSRCCRQRLFNYYYCERWKWMCNDVVVVVVIIILITTRSSSSKGRNGSSNSNSSSRYYPVPLEEKKKKNEFLCLLISRGGSVKENGDTLFWILYYTIIYPLLFVKWNISHCTISYMYYENGNSWL